MKTPISILEKFEKASEGMEYGTATLSLTIKMGKPLYIIERKDSYISDDDRYVSNFGKQGGKQ